MPWQKKSKKSAKNDKTGEWEDKWVEIDAFSVSFVRNGNQNFVIGLEPGETEEVVEYMRFVLHSLFQARFTKQQADFAKSRSKKGNDGPAPF